METERFSRKELRAQLRDDEGVAAMRAALPDAKQPRFDELVREWRNARSALKAGPTAEPPGMKGPCTSHRIEAPSPTALKRQIGRCERALEALVTETRRPRPRPAPSRTYPREPTIPIRIEQVDGELEAWDRFVLGNPAGTLYHSASWLQLTGDAFGHPTRRFVAYDDASRPVGVLPVTILASNLFGRFAVSLPWVNYGGALADSPTVAEALMQKASSALLAERVRHVEFRDIKPREGWPVRVDKVNMILPLPADPGTLWNGLGSKLRAQVRKPQREPHWFRVGAGELLDDFYRVYTRNMRDLGTPPYARQFFALLLKRFPEAARVAVLWHREEPVSAGILLRHRGQLEIPWASTVRHANRFGMNSLFYWKVLEHGVETAARTFDFGRSTRDAGTYRFKKQWGAQPLQLHWHYALPAGEALPDLRPDNPRYAAAIALWRRLPVALTRVIGPPIVQNLP
ncbi:MAG: FemAB family XrtA/PEP-CTERM system-associated protein [Pseudomonadales bacterium]|jgi:FemAB-related protein (PEP-CTERM system-associated)|nr:FemAB family XrtA/PEP-CTERM system-associated protein [Pseudomonadales bacterium]